MNPLVVTGDRVVPLDLAAKIDETASFLCAPQWGQIDFPAPFGRAEFPEESYIRELDAKTGEERPHDMAPHTHRVLLLDLPACPCR